MAGRAACRPRRPGARRMLQRQGQWQRCLY
eukprot:SM008677S23421  [mRNA]  locus=s8677:98:404:+ [translate_table: standard]